MSFPAGWWAHPSAVVDPGAEIGDGTRIWHFSHVMAGARIGRGCSLGQNVFVAAGTRLGDNVKVQNNVSIYEGVELSDDVFCGPSMVFTNVVNPRSHVSRRHEYRPTRVGRGATFGANSTIVCGHSVGRYAFVGAAAVVTTDVPDFALVLGVPGRVVGYVCRCGVRLALAPRGPLETAHSDSGPLEPGPLESGALGSEALESGASPGRDAGAEARDVACGSCDAAYRWDGTGLSESASLESGLPGSDLPGSDLPGSDLPDLGGEGGDA